MGKIYKAPDTIELPKVDFGKYNREEEKKKEDKYLSDLAAWCKKRKDQQYVGEVVRFPHADGYAQYMVASIKPLELVHLELGDAWDLPYIERLKAKDIIEKIEREKAFAEIWAKHK